MVSEANFALAEGKRTPLAATDFTSLLKEATVSRGGPELRAEALLDGAIATLECTTVETISAGDHDLFIGRVDSMQELREGVAPLLYFRRRYLRIEQGADSPVEGKPEG